MTETYTRPEITTLLLGDIDAGKSTFIARITQEITKTGSLPSNTAPPSTITQPVILDIKFPGRPCSLKLYDTSSYENWKDLNANIVILCYDISCRLSLINVKQQWSQLAGTNFPDIPLFLLGLKRDLRSVTDPNGIIYPQEAYQIAQELRCDKYMECSAVTGELVKEVTEDICRTAFKTLKGGGESEGGCRVM